MTTYEQAYSAYAEWIGMSSRPGRKSVRRGRPAKRRKIVIASDFHVPFHDKDALKGLLAEGRDTDLLVINGDLLDCWSTSRYSKATRVTDPCQEMAEGQAVLNILAESFNQIVIVGGNHDSRPAKYMTDRLPPDVLDYIRLTGPMVFKPLEWLAAGLENVKIAEPIKAQNAEFSFLYQHGDLICTHAEVYSRIPGKATTGNVLSWLKSFAEAQGIIQPFRCLIQGHTHQYSQALADYGVLAIEGGCMSTLQDYHGNARIQSPRPLAVGWTVVYQDGPRTDFRSSRFIPFTA